MTTKQGPRGKGRAVLFMVSLLILASCALFTIGAADAVSTTMTVVCSPQTLPEGSQTTCTATVTGQSPTGFVSWTTSSGTASDQAGFSSSTCLLSGGACTVTYAVRPAYCPAQFSQCSLTIYGEYQGDANNNANSGSFALAVTTASSTTTTSSTVTSPSTTTVSCTPSALASGQQAKCTATVTMSYSPPSSGYVQWTSSVGSSQFSSVQQGGTLAGDTCAITPPPGTCSVYFTAPASSPPTVQINAVYTDTVSSSNGTFDLVVGSTTGTSTMAVSSSIVSTVSTSIFPQSTSATSLSIPSSSNTNDWWENLESWDEYFPNSVLSWILPLAFYSGGIIAVLVVIFRYVFGFGGKGDAGEALAKGGPETPPPSSHVPKNGEKFKLGYGAEDEELPGLTQGTSQPPAYDSYSTFPHAPPSEHPPDPEDSSKLHLRAPPDKEIPGDTMEGQTPPAGTEGGVNFNIPEGEQKRKPGDLLSGNPDLSPTTPPIHHIDPEDFATPPQEPPKLKMTATSTIKPKDYFSNMERSPSVRTDDSPSPQGGATPGRPPPPSGYTLVPGNVDFAYNPDDSSGRQWQWDYGKKRWVDVLHPPGSSDKIPAGYTWVPGEPNYIHRVDGGDVQKWDPQSNKFISVK